MSQENVDLVRASLEAWNTEDMDALREFYDPGVTVRPPDGWPEPGPSWVGRRSCANGSSCARHSMPTPWS